MNAKAIMVILFVSISYTESSYFARRDILSRQRAARPTTCSIQKLTDKKLSLTSRRLPANLSCNADEVVDMTSNNQVPEAAVGIQCTFSYSCHFDAPESRRISILTCGTSGNWEGAEPDCTEDDEIAEEIVRTYELTNLREVDEEVDVEAELENEMESADNSTEESTSSSSFPLFGVRKNAKQQKYIKVLQLVCDRERMCTSLTSLEDCSRAVPQHFPQNVKTLRTLFTLICRSCYAVFCTTSIDLI